MDLCPFDCQVMVSIPSQAIVRLNPVPTAQKENTTACVLENQSLNSVSGGACCLECKSDKQDKDLVYV